MAKKNEKSGWRFWNEATKEERKRFQSAAATLRLAEQEEAKAKEIELAERSKASEAQAKIEKAKQELELKRPGRAVEHWWKACANRQRARYAAKRQERDEFNRRRTMHAIKALRIAPELFRIEPPLPGKNLALVRFVSTKHKGTSEHQALHLSIAILKSSQLQIEIPVPTPSTERGK